MVTTSPSANTKQATGYNTNQKQTKLQTQKGHMAITSTKNIKIGQKSVAITSAKTKNKT